MNKTDKGLSGFAALTKGLGEAPTEQPKDPEQVTSPAMPSATEKARRAGKTSNPHFKRVMVLVEKDTAKAAGRKWEDAQPEKDFSDLIQGLLAAYNAGQISI